MTARRHAKREARWQELRERCNDAAGFLYVTTTRFTVAQHSGTAQEIDRCEKELAIAEKRYAKTRSTLARFVAGSIAVKLTADTITDEQIRELQTSLVECGPAANLDAVTCSVALAKWRDPAGLKQRASARARCAEIINARAEAKP